MESLHYGDMHVSVASWGRNVKAGILTSTLLVETRVRGLNPGIEFRQRRPDSSCPMMWLSSGVDRYSGSKFLVSIGQPEDGAVSLGILRAEWVGRAWHFASSRREMTSKVWFCSSHLIFEMRSP